MKPKKTVSSVSEFKTHALEFFSEVESGHREYEIIKRGKPIAKVIPFEKKTSEFPFGCCQEMRVEIGDVLSPMGEDEWSGIR